MIEQFIITEKCSTIRMLAREALRGRWKLGFAAMLLYTVAIYIPSLILTEIFGDIASIYSILVTGPLLLGCSIFILSLFRNQEPQVTQIFYGFERFGKALGLYLAMALFIGLWSLIMIPFAVAAIFFPFLIPLALLSAVPMIMAVIRYSQAFFILADSPETGVFECIRRSKRLMSGNKMKLFLLYLSFIGWAIAASLPPSLASVVILGPDLQDPLYLSELSFIGPPFLIILASVGFVFLETYIMTSLAAFYDMASGNLRPGCIVSSAEVVQPDEQAQAQTFEQAQMNEQEQVHGAAQPDQAQTFEQAQADEPALQAQADAGADESKN